MIKLKPCPFCGSQARIIRAINADNYLVRCVNDDCEAGLHAANSSPSEEYAAEKWNTRPEF